MEKNDMNACKHLRVNAVEEPPPENAEINMEKYEIQAQNIMIEREINDILEFERQED